MDKKGQPIFSSGPTMGASPSGSNSPAPASVPGAASPITPAAPIMSSPSMPLPANPYSPRSKASFGLKKSKKPLIIAIIVIAVIILVTSFIVFIVTRSSSGDSSTIDSAIQDYADFIVKTPEGIERDEEESEQTFAEAIVYGVVNIDSTALSAYVNGVKSRADKVYEFVTHSSNAQEDSSIIDSIKEFKEYNTVLATLLATDATLASLGETYKNDGLDAALATAKKYGDYSGDNAYAGATLDVTANFYSASLQLMSYFENKSCIESGRIKESCTLAASESGTDTYIKTFIAYSEAKQAYYDTASVFFSQLFSVTDRIYSYAGGES